MRLLPYGDRAVLVELHDIGATLAMAASVRAADLPGVVDVVPAERTVLVTTSGDVAELGRALRALRPAQAGQMPPGEVVEVPVSYDGPDLDQVAALTGLSPEQVVAAHTGRPWVAAFCGFVPGFAYLVGGDERLRVPRLDSPRPRVPAGAVGLAGDYSGVYPRASPGGWRLIGRTAVPLWDPGRDPPALLHPGVRVQFVPATDSLPPSPPGRDADPTRTRTDRAAIKVVAAGPAVLVQDLGRPGLANLGVGRCGAADRGAHALAQRLVANDEGAAGLEVLLGGLRLRARGDLLVAVTGAPTPLSVDGRRVALAAPVPLRAGQELALGTPPRGLRSYVGVRGGLDLPPVLGSRSTDADAGLGPAPVTVGDLLPVGRPPDEWPLVDVAPYAEPGRDLVTLSVTPGPRADRLRDPVALARTTWTVSPHSDRMGVRLDGPPLTISDEPVLSEGVVPGAVQVPPSGQPLVFSVDCPVTGGYPVVAVVRETDALAQLRPGQRVHLRW